MSDVQNLCPECGRAMPAGWQALKLTRCPACAQKKAEEVKPVRPLREGSEAVSLMDVDAFGCVWEVWYDYDPGQPYPTYSCGGVPPSYDFDIVDVTLEDVDELLSWTPFEEADEKLDDRLQAYLERCAQRRRPLHPKMKAFLKDYFHDQVEEVTHERN